MCYLQRLLSKLEQGQQYVFLLDVELKVLLFCPMLHIVCVMSLPIAAARKEAGFEFGWLLNIFFGVC